MGKAHTVRKVVVIGAAGNIGAPVVSVLLTTKRFTVSALTRASSESSFPPSVTPIKTDYSHASLLSAFKVQDAIVCTIATSNLADQQRIVDAAAEAGIKRFMPSEFGFDTGEDVVMTMAPCTLLKRDTIKYLREKEGMGMGWTNVVSGL